MGLYTITSRSDGTVLTGFGSTSDLFNTDHLNHVTHTEPDSINSWENSALEMDTITDPAPSGVVSLANSLSDELERLRFTLSQLKAAISGGQSPPKWWTPTGNFNFTLSLPITAARMNAASLRTIPNNATTTIAWTVATDTTYATPNSMAQVIGIRAPVEGIYMVGARASAGDVTTTGPSVDFQVIVRREVVVGDTVDIQPIAMMNVHSNGATVPKAVTVETVAHIDANRRFSLAIYQSSGAPLIISEGPSLWAALVGR